MVTKNTKFLWQNKIINFAQIGGVIGGWISLMLFIISIVLPGLAIAG